MESRSLLYDGCLCICCRCHRHHHHYAVVTDHRRCLSHIIRATVHLLLFIDGIHFPFALLRFSPCRGCVQYLPYSVVVWVLCVLGDSRQLRTCIIHPLAEWRTMSLSTQSHNAMYITWTRWNVCLLCACECLNECVCMTECVCVCYLFRLAVSFTSTTLVYCLLQWKHSKCMLNNIKRARA